MTISTSENWKLGKAAVTAALLSSGSGTSATGRMLISISSLIIAKAFIEHVQHVSLDGCMIKPATRKEENFVTSWTGTRFSNHHHQDKWPP
jgi:hypothetical protein